jgi:hypothetical protein
MSHLLKIFLLNNRNEVALREVLLTTKNYKKLKL